MVTLSGGALHAVCVETLPLSASAPLPMRVFAHATSVAWTTDGRLLIGGKTGINTYDPAKRTFAPLVSGDDLPNGIPEVEAFDSDGHTIIAVNINNSDVVANAKTGRITSARTSHALFIRDVAIHQGKVAILGVPFFLKGTDYAQLWIGEPGAPWETFLPLHPVDPKLTDLVRYAVPPTAGAVTFTGTGTVAMISPSEPGVFQYKIDGTPLPTLGRNVRELVVPHIADVLFHYAKDIEGRYREIFNKQPTIDDLLSTSDGLAIVVRKWTAGRVGWELWFPDSDGIRRRLIVGATMAGSVGGHLHCAARRSQVACVFGLHNGPPEATTSQLLIFDLKGVTRSEGCR